MNSNKLPRHIFTIDKESEASGSMDENDNVKVPSATSQINVAMVGTVDRTWSHRQPQPQEKKRLNKGATEICFMAQKHFSIGQC